MTLNDKQVRHLRSLAHHLKPVVWVGQHGIKPSIIEEVNIALDSHELIKVKLVADKATRISMIGELTEATQAQLVQHIGQMAVLFRRNEEKPKVVIPSK